ncbi:MAG: hypothetical protein QN183_15300 [Armatimonadota bacterium]|nr:hypothetical protein [Armatimonadota bacterium]MDR7545002.1 hypothetical protein [Armatimonadota bacterium]
MSEVDVVQPDLVYVTAGRLGVVTDQAIQGAPDLVEAGMTTLPGTHCRCPWLSVRQYP